MSTRERLRGRVGEIQQRLTRHADTSLGRLSLLWFRRYFEASHNSGSAASVYLFLSVAPMLLALTGLFHAAGADTNAVAERLIDHNNLTGATADLVRETFGSAADNALAATLAAAVGFLLWGIGIGQIYQDVYARAWNVQIRTLSDQARFTVWFFVLSGLMALFVLFSAEVKSLGIAAVVPVWLVVSTAFWLWTPRFLTRGTIEFRKLLPGALLASVVIGGAIATSPLFLGSMLNSDGNYFGSFGIVLGLFAWTFILVTLSMVCAVFSAVWAEWREAERIHSLEAAVSSR